MNVKKRITFLTATRADFGKLQPLIESVYSDEAFDVQILATGMHLLAEYGLTVNEIYRAGFRRIHAVSNQDIGDGMADALAGTVRIVTRYLEQNDTDLLIVHGDRIEPMGATLAACLRNVRVGHIEGGEVSGTVDEMLRHSISKLAHVHFVSNEDARNRLLRMGEAPESIFVIGSPSLDLIFSDRLPAFDAVRRHYEIPFEDYVILALHPVTTDKTTGAEANAVADALLASGRNAVVILPNNDAGRNLIEIAYRKFDGNPRIRKFPSIRFESYLTLLKNAECILGNSSSGIHEAPAFGVPTINVGTRQHARSDAPSIVNVSSRFEDIRDALAHIRPHKRFEPSYRFGRGESAANFRRTLDAGALWRISVQKKFHEGAALG